MNNSEIDFTKKDSDRGVWIDTWIGDKCVISAHRYPSVEPDNAFTTFWTGAALPSDLFRFVAKSAKQIRDKDRPGEIHVLAYDDNEEFFYTVPNLDKLYDTADDLARLNPLLPQAKLFRLEYKSRKGDLEYVVWARAAHMPADKIANATEMGVYARPSQFARIDEMMSAFIAKTNINDWKQDILYKTTRGLLSYVSNLTAVSEANLYSRNRP